MAPNNPFSFGERLGLVFVAQTAALSALSVIYVLLLVLRSIQVSRQNGSKYQPFSHPIGLQFMSLLFFDLVQSLGSILHIPWISEAGVLKGNLCTLQAILKQAGDVGVALTTSTIAVHTFLVLAFKIEVKPIYAKLVVLLTYVVVIIFVGIGFAISARDNLPSIYGDTGYWCWITDDYDEERIVLEYLWLWLAALVSLFCYTGMALIIRGNLVFDHKGFRLTGGKRPEFLTTTAKHGSIVWQMLFYPAVYIVCIIPISVVRFISFSGHEVPYQALFFSSCLFSASGLFNSLLFAYTRPSLSFHGVPTKPGTTPAIASYPSPPDSAVPVTLPMTSFSPRDPSSTKAYYYSV